MDFFLFILLLLFLTIKVGEQQPIESFEEYRYIVNAPYAAQSPYCMPCYNPFPLYNSRYSYGCTQELLLNRLQLRSQYILVCELNTETVQEKAFFTPQNPPSKRVSIFFLETSVFTLIVPGSDFSQTIQRPFLTATPFHRYSNHLQNVCFPVSRLPFWSMKHIHVISMLINRMKNPMNRDSAVFKFNRASFFPDFPKTINNDSNGRIPEL